MEFFDIVMLFVCSGFAIFISLPFLLSYKQERNMETFWQKFANDKDFLYTPGTSSRRGEMITGVYRGYLLKISNHRPDPFSDGIFTDIELIAQDKNARTGELYTSPIDIEALVRNFILDFRLAGQLRLSEGRVRYQLFELRDNATYLTFILDWLRDLNFAYSTLAQQDSKAALFLLKSLSKIDPELQPHVICLLQKITQNTNQLEHRFSRLTCPQCLTRYTKHNIQHHLLANVLIYYGCRVCHQSTDFIESQTVAAILDNSGETKVCQQEGVLWVNWSIERTLFDFDVVKIKQANDEEVERFAMQVGNDTDPVRKASYKKIRCLVSAECDLSENTLRILERMLGQVEGVTN